MAVISDEEFVELIRKYTVNLYRLALGILHNPADAEDAVSETVLKAYEKVHTLHKRESFKPWLLKIAANEAKSLYAKNRRTAPDDNIEEYMPAFCDEYHELWDVVMKLEEPYREVVILFFYERFSMKEISRILGIPEGTVKSRLSRGKKQLKQLLK
ncbi:MAG: RNA polymerase sigma factor [Butyrivibrio sp.]|nr:RNA polymerase sigma factor [Butyrivibrio sp.]